MLCSLWRNRKIQLNAVEKGNGSKQVGKAKIEVRAYLFAYEHHMPLSDGYRVENGQVHFNKRAERTQEDAEYMLRLIEVSCGEQQHAEIKSIAAIVRFVFICEIIAAVVIGIFLAGL